MDETSQTQINSIKARVAQMSGTEKIIFLRGLRDGLDLAQLICDEKRKFSLASDAVFTDFLDYLDKED